LYGPPGKVKFIRFFSLTRRGTGKTLLARACAAQTNSCFLKLAGPQLVQMFIGDGAKLVRDAFALAKVLNKCYVFIRIIKRKNLPLLFLLMNWMQLGQKDSTQTYLETEYEYNQRKPPLNIIRKFNELCWNC
jgi:hypothetical protein